MGLGEGVSKDFRNIYRNMMAVLEEVRMGWAEGDGSRVG